MKRLAFRCSKAALIVAIIGCAQETLDIPAGVQSFNEIESLNETEATESSSYSESQDTEQTSVSAIVDRLGGVLQLGNIARVDIPEASVETATEVYLSAEEITFPLEGFFEHAVPIGPVLELLPELDASPRRNIAVSIPIGYLSYILDTANLYLVNRPCQWLDSADGQRSVSINYTYWRAAILGDQVMALVDHMCGNQFQFVWIEPDK